MEPITAAIMAVQAQAGNDTVKSAVNDVYESLNAVIFRNRVRAPRSAT